MFVPSRKNRGRCAIVLRPHERMANDLHLVRPGKIHERIRQREVESTFRDLHRVRLQTILGRTGAELVREQQPIVGPFRNAVMNAHANGEQSDRRRVQRAWRMRFNAESQIQRDWRKDEKSCGAHASA